MLDIIATMIIGLLFAFFATQNAGPVTLHIASFSLTGIPLYLIILASMLLGILVSSIVSAVNSVSTMFRLSNKDAKINENESRIEELTEKIHSLELENARLRGENNTEQYVPLNTKHTAHV